MWHRKLTSTASLLPTINHFGPEQGSATVGTPDQARPECCLEHIQVLPAVYAAATAEK